MRKSAKALAGKCLRRLRHRFYHYNAFAAYSPSSQAFSHSFNEELIGNFLFIKILDQIVKLPNIIII